MNESKESLIPKQQVIDDMYSDGLIRDGARSYYYRYYATLEERLVMKREDKWNRIICFVFWVLYLVMTVGCGIWVIIEHLL